MSFDFDMSQVLQYSTNVFGSLLPMIYLFFGAAFAIFIFVAIVKFLRSKD